MRALICLILATLLLSGCDVLAPAVMQATGTALVAL